MMRKIEAHTPLRPEDFHQVMTRCRVCLRVTIGKLEKKPDEIDPDGNVTYDDRQTFAENAIRQFFPVNVIYCRHCTNGTICDLMQILPAKKDKEEK